MHKKPRIDCNAVPAYAGTWLQYINAWVAVRQPNHLPDINSDPVANNRKLIGEGDVEIAKRVLTQFDELGRHRGGPDAFPPYETLVELDSALRAFLGQAADRTVVLLQLNENAARQHAFRAVSDMNGCSGFRTAGDAKVGTQARDQFTH